MLNRLSHNTVSDTVIADAIAEELDRQKTQIELIASKTSFPPMFWRLKARC